MIYQSEDIYMLCTYKHIFARIGGCTHI